jgi:CubicO group peptidase (beta-lactamase class C family)
MLLKVFPVAAALCAAAAPAAAVASDKSAIHDVVAARIAAGEIPGAVVLVSRSGKVTALEAQGVSSLRPGAVPLQPDSVVWLASMTKPVVAATVMMLVDAGKVRIDDPVSKYIPEFRNTQVRLLKPGFSYPAGRVAPNAPPLQYDIVPAARPLLVRDFMTFTAGLQTIGIPNDTLPPITDEDTLATWVPKLGAATLDFQPGSRWAYSNATGFEVLARIVEVVSGQPYASFVKQRVFDPLRMVDTSFGPRADLAARTLPLGMMANNPIMKGKFSSGSAGLLSTATDYSHFAEMLVNGGIWRGKRILSAAAVAEMTRNQIGDIGMAGIDPGQYGGLQTTITPGIKYGYGVAVLTDAKSAGRALPNGSFGWDGVGTRRMWAIPSTKTVVVILVPEAGPATAAPTHKAIEAVVGTAPTR